MAEIAGASWSRVSAYENPGVEYHRLDCNGNGDLGTSWTTPLLELGNVPCRVYMVFYSEGNAVNGANPSDLYIYGTVGNARKPPAPYTQTSELLPRCRYGFTGVNNEAAVFSDPDNLLDASADYTNGWWIYTAGVKMTPGPIVLPKLYLQNTANDTTGTGKIEFVDAIAIKADLF